MIHTKELAVIMKSVGKFVHEYVGAALVKVSTQIAELGSQIKAIPSGPAGERGEKGERGDPGKSITGPKGDTGNQGEVGPAGPKGEAGKDGPIGPSGEKGLDGNDGKDGRDGRDGIAGKDGRDGINGRDALEIDIIPAIDPAKSYPRGTFAQYQRGLLRALVNTEPGDTVNMMHWTVIAGGVDDVRYPESDDPLVYSVEHHLTGGVVKRMDRRLPVPVHMGVFRDGTEYLRGQCVVWDGSTWIVRAATTKARPGEQHADWQLIVKRGRDGKSGENGKDGERGPQGPEGKPGKDRRYD